jgi:hypothetical protein
LHQLVAEVLAAWRHAERLSHELPQGSPDHERVLLASEQLQAAYVDLTKADTSASADERGGLFENGYDPSPVAGIGDG